MAATDTYSTNTIGISNRLSAATHSIFGAFSIWNDRRSTRKMLNALSDRELEDIGLCRSDIDDIAG